MAIKSRRFFGLLLFLAMSSDAAAQPRHPLDDNRDPIGLFPSHPELSRFFLEYKRAPDPRAAFDRLFALDLFAWQQAGKQRGDPHYLPMLLAFYVHVARSQPELLKAATARAIAEKDRRGGLPRIEVLHSVVYFSGVGGSGPLLERLRAADAEEGRRMAADVAGRPVFPYLQLKPEHPQTLDVLWAAYFGSGDPRYVDLISEALVNWRPWHQMKRRIDELTAALRANAKDDAALAELYRIAAALAAYKFLRNNARYDTSLALTLFALSASKLPQAATVRAIVEELKEPSR